MRFIANAHVIARGVA